MISRSGTGEVVRSDRVHLRSTLLPALLTLTALVASACGGGAPGPASLGSSPEPAIAPALPATEVANAAPDEPMEPSEAFRLVEQGTFGPQQDDIDFAARSGPETWINQQMAEPATFMSVGLAGAAQRDRWNEYVNVWWRMAIQADDQLRQRVAFALSEIFVVSGANGLGEHQEGLANYYDILLRNAFGNYRDLIEDITLNPIMGEYLSMKGNRKPDTDENIRPDENYARELLQLFSIGLVQLNRDGSVKLDGDGVPLPTYDQSTVEGFAHVFTGWHYANADDFRWPEQKDYIRPMKPWPEFHDTAPKTLLDGFVLPGGQTPEQDLQGALDNVFHHPNVGPFIVRQLIQRLVTSNPSPGYVRDVVSVFERNAAGVRGSFGSTIKAILMHREARSGHLDKPDTFGKMKEPLLRVTQLWRAFEPDSIHRDFHYGWVGNELEQAPLGAPSVFNFFRPDFAPPGGIADRGLVAPEFEVLDESSVVLMTTRLLANSIWSHNYKSDLDPQRISIDITREMALEPNREALIDHLDDLLLGGRMSMALRNDVRALMGERDYKNGASQRVGEAIFLIITSPEAAVQI